MYKILHATHARMPMKHSTTLGISVAWRFEEYSSGRIRYNVDDWGLAFSERKKMLGKISLKSNKRQQSASMTSTRTFFQTTRQLNKYMYSSTIVSNYASTIPRKQRCSIGGTQLITWPQNELFILRIQKDSTTRYIWLWQLNIYERALIKTYRG